MVDGMEPMTNEHLTELAQRAFIFGYSLVYDLNEVTSQTTAPKVNFVGPVNVFGHSQRLADHNDKFVTLNNDTVYSAAHCDVADEPLVLHLPDTHDRYYVMQFIDPWSNNVAYIGRRASGTAEATYLLAGPEWDGEVPTGMTLVQAPNTVFTILGRFAVDGAADLSNVVELQANTWLTPLSLYPERPDNSSRSFGDWEIAPYNQDVPEPLVWWEKFRSWMALFPPPAADNSFVASLEPLGLLGNADTYRDVNEGLRDALQAGAEQGLASIGALVRSGSVEPVNGWVQALHSFDYNLDRLGPGTIDSPEWKIPDRATSYIVRAACAMGGLWGNHGYEADYVFVFVDHEGQPLSGAHRYQVHFDDLPPVDAFWSITMYDLPQYYLIENPINRYSIGDRSPGLVYNADGSLDIWIQHDTPGAERASNWLPAPVGAFRPIMRMYQPREAVLNSTYDLPPIVRLDD